MIWYEFKVGGKELRNLFPYFVKFLVLLTILVAPGLNQPGYSETIGTATTSILSLKEDRPSSTLTLNEVSADSAATPRTPVYPEAIRGWNVPLGQRERKPGSVINRFIIHHTTNTGDESPYFLRKNERSSCPTWYVMSNGDVIEFISPVKRPSSTGAANDYSVAVETQNTSRAPDWGISDAAHESIARIAAWLSKQSSLGPYPVDIKLDRTHIIGHNEAGVNKTVCPGPSMRLDWIVERAKQLAVEPGDERAPRLDGQPVGGAVFFDGAG